MASLVLRRTAGLAVGVAVSLAVTRLADTFRFGVQSNDPVVPVAAASVLVAVSLAALRHE